MRLKLHWIAVVCLLLPVIEYNSGHTAVAAFQEQQNPPQQDPQQDPHKNQPATCRNYDKGEEKHNCDCHKSCDPKEAHEDAACKTYCRPDACLCNHGCQTAEMRAKFGKMKPTPRS